MNSSTGTMSGPESFNNVGLPKNSVPPQMAVHNMRLSFSSDGTAVYKSMASTSPPYQHGVSPGGGANGNGPGDGSVPMVSPPGVNTNLSSGEPQKRKRGRPRKYGPDGSMALALSPAPPSVAVTQSGNGVGLSSPPAATPVSGGPMSPNSSKKARGRPPGSSKKQQMDSLGSAGFGFTPHVITVKAGEDVSSKIMAFSQNGPRAVCILSANGAISNVTLRQAATSGGTVTYEGRFEILSLSGSFLLSENAGQRSRTGGLSVSLSGPDGRVLGGGVAGLLTAASPVQVIVGSFVPEGRKEPKSSNQMEHLSGLPKVTQNSGATGASSPPSRGTLSESSGGPGSPLNQSTGACNNSNPHGMSSIPWK